MRFPSLQNIIKEVSRVIRQYPLECVAVVTGTIAFLHMVEDRFYETDVLAKIVFTSLLALPSYLAITLRSRYKQLGLGQTILEYVLVTGLLVAFYFTLAHQIDERDTLHFAILNVAAHLLVSCAGFIGRGSMDSFWQFNQILFIRIITAGIFSVVLFAGLAGALASLDALFAFSVPENAYLKLAIIIFGVFQTFFFLAAVPENAQSIENQNTQYPTVLKVFTQFVLVPLVIVYLIILLSYEAKIILNFNLPKGWVTYLILGYGIAGILSILLVYPIKNREGNTWIKTFAKWFYILLLPLVALMWVAIIKRVNDYGFTIERVIVIALAIWLTCIALFYLLKPKGDIRIIPFSLAITALLISAVGWRIAQASQRKILVQVLTDSGIMKDNIVVAKANNTVSFKDRQRITSVIEYLLKYHGSKSVLPWLDVAKLDAKTGTYAYQQTSLLMAEQLHLKAVNAYEIEGSENSWIQYKGYGAFKNIAADIIFPFDTYGSTYDTAGIHFAIEDRSYLQLMNGKQAISEKIFPGKFGQNLYQQLGAEAELPIDSLKQTIVNEQCIIHLYYTELSGNTSDSLWKNFNFRGVALVQWTGN